MRDVPYLEVVCLCTIYGRLGPTVQNLTKAFLAPAVEKLVKQEL
jgi:hypothetical protein